ncbi:caspase family protein [Pseudoalteromonas luteoviolacea]|uniref:caspase family protein n=1 Tax=Pseudoalteromonas luteoviolacea TaxID=43657 RepID=UPI001152EF0A|nr:caspase family protein [Pseudoalteromonas luteoviolacea]TQF71337.1 hypothetical protein FLM44_09675 [Pseudoalteromonas luteoviolacea]
MNPNHYALVIGINDYPEAPSRYRLDGAVNDAKAVTQWLCDPSGGGLEEKNCYTLFVDSSSRQKDDMDTDNDEIEDEVEPYPVRYHVDKELKKIRTLLRKQLKESNQPAERFYFYFSGHGEALRMQNDNVLMCMANWSPDSPNANLSSRLILKEFLERCLPCNEIVVWTDCCRSRTVDVRGGGLDIGCRNSWKEGHVPDLFWANATLHETAAHESLNSTGKSFGYFTKALINGLQSGVQNTGITWDGLRDYLRLHVETLAQKDGFPQRAQSNHTAGSNKKYFGKHAGTAKLVINLNGEGRNLRLLLNASIEKKSWSNASGKLTVEGLELGLYKLIDTDTNASMLIDCSSPIEEEIHEF